MKKGIALFITISFIVVFTALIAYILSKNEKNFKEVDSLKQRVQRVIFYDDGKKIIDRFARDIKKSFDLDEFFSKASSFVYTGDKFTLSVNITPLSNKLNINSIYTDKKIDENISGFFDSICNCYNILDCNFFKNLILDTIDEDNKERVPLSEIQNYDIKFSNSLIFDFDHFKQLLLYYQKNTGDASVLKVPWDRIIFFGDNKKGIIDCDKISKELVCLFGLDNETFKGCEDLNQSQEYQEIAKKYTLKSFDKGEDYYILVKIIQTDGISNDTLKFIYNLKTKKASRIELFHN